MMQNVSIFIREIQAQGVALSVSGADSLRVKGRMTAEQKETLKARKAEIMELLALPSLENISLTARLNRMYEHGARFEVGDSFFKTTGELSAADAEFLRTNEADILTTLQQNCLMKYVFPASPQVLKDFGVEIVECSALLVENDIDSDKAHFQAVRQITQKWFSGLLKLI